MGNVKGDPVVRPEPLEQVEEDDRIDHTGDGDEGRLAGIQHPMLIDCGSDPFREHGADCVDTNARNQCLARFCLEGKLRLG